MSRSQSQNRRPLGSESRSPPRDPRIRGRTASTHASDYNAEPPRLHPSELRESSGRADGSSASNTPRSATGGLETAPSTLAEPSNLQLAFSSHTRNVAKLDYLGRERNHLKREVDSAHVEYEKFKPIKDKFPAVAEQALQRKTTAETKYGKIKQEEVNAKAAEQTSSDHFIRLLLQLIQEKNEQHSDLAAQVAVLQKELQEVRSQQAIMAATPVLPSEEVKTRLQKLEDFQIRQLSDKPNFKAIDEKLRTMRQNIDDLRNRHLDLKDVTDKRYHQLRDDSERDYDKLQSRQRASSDNATKAFDAFKLEVKGLRQRVDGMAQKMSPIESQLQDFGTLRTSEQEIQNQIQQLQEASNVQQQAAGEIERLRKTIHLRVENMRGELKDDITNIKTELLTIRENQVTLSQNNSQNDESQRIPTMEADINSLKKSNQDQLERVTAMDTSLEEISDQVKSVEAQFSHFTTMSHPPAIPDEVRVLQSQFAELSSAEKQLTQKFDTIQHFITDVKEKYQSADPSTIFTEVKAVEAQVTEHTARLVQLEQARKKEEEMLNSRLAEQSANQAHSAERLNDSMLALQTEFTNYTNRWKASETTRDRALVEAVTKVQEEQAGLRATIYGQHPQQTLSQEPLQQAQPPTNIASNVRNLMSQVAALQKGLEKQTHMSVNLTQRFNNLTTEALARQIVGVANKALPNLEKGLKSVEGDLLELRGKMDRVQNDREEGISAETMKRFVDIEEKVDGVETTVLIKHESLMKSFEEGRDMLMGKFEQVEASIGRNETSQKTYRDSTTANLKALETQVETVNVELEAVKRFHGVPTRDQKTIPVIAESAKHEDSDASSGQRKLDSHTVEPRPGNSSAHDSNGRIQRTLDDDSDYEEMKNGDALLASFKKPPGLIPPTSTLSKQSPRVTQLSQGTSKRKRSESVGDSDESHNARNSPRSRKSKIGRKSGA